MKPLLLIAMFVFCAAPSFAQSSVTVAWDYAVPVATVAGYTQAILIDGVAQAGTPACAPKAGAPTQTTCSLALPMPTNAPHVAIVRATSGTTVAELTVNGFNPAAGPMPGSGFRTTVTVVVTIP